MIKIASLFSGIGGFEKGLLQAIPNAEIVFSSEIDKYARQIYKKNYGVEPHGDITKIKASSIPNHDILCGGFPCQAFSIAGKRRGFEDTRGTLFFEIMRIAKVKRPKLLYFENVRGLLSHDEGRTFQTILRSMDDLGYDAEWQVFNSKNHGVSQNRERVFIIGHLRGGCTRPIFPITESRGLSNEEEPTVYCIDANYYKGVAQQARSVIALTEVRTDEAKKIRRETKDRDFSPRRGKELVPLTDGLMNCITSGKNKEQFITCHSTLPRSSKSGKGGTGHLQRDDGLSYCCDACNNISIEVNQKIRRLTPIECERLQGFPDNWTEGISDTQRYKCLGNAVTVNVIEFISLHIKEMLLNKDA
jgi:DNA (cytosine-5)-methyltransferase 1